MNNSYWRSVIDEIYDMISLTPNAIAVTDGDLEWTYHELGKRADAVVRHLADRGITRGSVIGMHMPRCADAIAALLGILASGCVYLPLDPSYPRARLGYMLDQTATVGVISSDSDPQLYGSHRNWLPLPSQLTGDSVKMTDQPPGIFPRGPFGPKDPAYILFTSGSTGEPKGVLVTHENITLMNSWSAEVLSITANDASATTCSLSFDASFHETLLPLSVGGTVHVIPHALALGQLTRPVSLVATTPTVANELLRAGQLPPLKVLMLGGEALASDAAALLLSSGRVATLLNCYGPTECTVCVTMSEVTAPVPEVIPIGRPVPGTQVLILDRNGCRLADGEMGEICVFGGQVVPGYVNDPAKTAERFGVGPTDAADPQRYYRTGDLGYRTADGLIYFAGRADQQVKVNGHRIELGEIDATLRAHPQIADAATIARDDGRIVAYVVPTQAGADVSASDLKKHASRSLPRFMLPAGIVTVAELPKTVSGKLDASALPEWSLTRADSAFTRTESLDDLTEHVIKIVTDVSGFVGRIRPSDDFLDDLGGTSLGIVQVLVEFERHFGRAIRINEALADTTVAGLASLVRGNRASPADFAFNTNGNAVPIFMIHAYLGGMLGLRRIAELLPPNQPTYGLQIYPDDERLDEERPEELNISMLAKNAVKRIREIQPTGRVILVGHSAGGLVVFEAARRILEAENLEPQVLLMDTPLPHNSLEFYWGAIIGRVAAILYSPKKEIRRAFTKISLALKTTFTISKATSQIDEDLVVLTEKRMKSVDTAVRHYRAQSYNGSIALMRTRRGRVLAMGRRSFGWASVTGGAISRIDVPGGHLSMLDAPNIETVTDKLVLWLSS